MKIIITTCLIASAILGWIVKPEYENKHTKIVYNDPQKPLQPEPKDRESETDKKAQKAVPKSKTAITLPTQEKIATQVREVFKEDPETAVAVFRAESGLRADAQGWNCHYDGKSKPCKPEDRVNAWSVDCGVAQINTPGNTCPEHLYDPQTNLAEAYEKYTRRGWQPWVAHKQGKHLAFLK